MTMINIPPLPDFLSALDAVGYEWDMRADRMTWFGAFELIFGHDVLPPENSKEFYELIYPDDRHLVFGSDDQRIDRHYRLKLANGVIALVSERGTIEKTDGSASLQRGIIRVTDKQLDRLDGIEKRGRDILTGCFDRPYVLTQIGKAMDAAKASRRSAAYLAVGIDKMSFVNEAVGMEAGDALLRGVAERLGQVMPTRAILGRVGGDMFGILLPEPLGGELHKLAERILKSFRDQPVVTPAAPLHITVSVGGVRLPAVAKNAAEGMIFAEQALHAAHQRGRNLFIEYIDSPERAQEHRKLLDLGERIKRAFKHDGFRLAYQPVIDARTGSTLFYEALVRMFDDAGKPISAAAFVPAIEQLGLAFELDQLVLDLAVKELELAPDLYLAVNVSGLTAAHANWPEHVQRVLGDRPHIAKRIIIEITETAAIVDVSETRRFVDTIRDLGALVSLDDFGAGFTSIRHLRSLGLSIMKIDKDLLHNLLTNAEQQHLVLVLIELAHGLSLKVVAEGVETADIADWLRRAKVDMLQGYYFGRPSLEREWIASTAIESRALPVVIPAMASGTSFLSVTAAAAV